MSSVQSVFVGLICGFIIGVLTVNLYSLLAHPHVSQKSAVHEVGPTKKQFRLPRAHFDQYSEPQTSTLQTCQKGYWDDTFQHWVASTTCKYKKYDVEEVSLCFQKHKRIVYIGDSVHRGMFWDLVDFLKALNPARYVQKIKKRFKEVHFTNFQDQDLVIYDRDTMEELFSIRFTYISNAMDFEGRCDLIHNWFFQCLESTGDILHKVMNEEVNVSRGGDKDKPVDVLYWNTGIWDFRTGLPVKYFKGNVSALLERERETFKLAKKVVWRTISASWPTKFASADECANKPRIDSRPCLIHTDGPFHYNKAVTPLMVKRGFDIVDVWGLTSQRPDLSHDGLHFRDCEHGEDCIYRVANMMFINSICN